MPSTYKPAPSGVPPAEALDADLQRISSAQSADATQLALNAADAQKQMRAPLAANQYLPRIINTLVYPSRQLPAIFDKMRGMKTGWDGRDSAPPSEQLIGAAETLWNIFKTSYPQAQEPTVKPGPDSLIEFCWTNAFKKKLLIIGLYGSETITCDWHLELCTVTNSGELDCFDLNQLLQEIYVYIHF
jgi:hypothetical protein